MWVKRRYVREVQRWTKNSWRMKVCKYDEWRGDMIEGWRVHVSTIKVVANKRFECKDIWRVFFQIRADFTSGWSNKRNKVRAVDSWRENWSILYMANLMRKYAFMYDSMSKLNLWWMFLKSILERRDMYVKIGGQSKGHFKRVGAAKMLVGHFKNIIKDTLIEVNDHEHWKLM